MTTRALELGDEAVGSFRAMVFPAAGTSTSNQRFVASMLKDTIMLRGYAAGRLHRGQ